MDRYTHNANESLHAQCSQETVEPHQLSVLERMAGHPYC